LDQVIRFPRRAFLLLLVPVLLTLGLVSGVSAQPHVSEPILQIETEMHTDNINYITNLPT
jgi:hypothetical protein